MEDVIQNKEPETGLFQLDGRVALVTGGARGLGVSSVMPWLSLGRTSRLVTLTRKAP